MDENNRNNYRWDPVKGNIIWFEDEILTRSYTNDGPEKMPKIGWYNQFEKLEKLFYHRCMFIA